MTFTNEQIKQLRMNRYVSRCTEASITFTPHFKRKVLKEYDVYGMRYREIFKNADFDLDVIGEDRLRNCIRNWKKVVKEKGIQGLHESRGRMKKRKQKEEEVPTTTDRVKRLEAEIAYLKKENDFLAQLRAKRTE